MALIFIFLTSLLVSLFITFPIMWLLRAFKVGQAVRSEGPQLHLTKVGTTTAGGLGIILTIIILTLIFIDFDRYPEFLALILLTAGFAAIGLTDDFLKVVRRDNLGLTFWQKILSQTTLAAFFSLFLVDFNSSFFIFYFLFFIFVIVGAANAANLTDGLNGLLAGTAGLAFLFFAVLANRTGFQDARIFSLIASGAVFAFLYFNFPNARLFMGDTGSLSLGAALAGLALILHQELRLAVIGGVFVIEALSVILQVASYKLFKRRIFKMAPLHHHFELMGWPERKVVIAFWLAAVVFGVAGVLL